ncbi:MAG: ribosome silencing factor [Bacteroidetes bacterium]|nr:ribosome silencing factor [Bacteroidota bacterium]
MRASTLAKKIARLTLSRKAYGVVTMDLRGLTSMADFFVVCSADSDIQVKAVAGAVVEGLKEIDIVPWHRESGDANWILLDYVDVVLHVFHKDTRTFYNLEKLWGDAKFERVDEMERSPVSRTSRRRTGPVKKKAIRQRAAG